MKNIKEKKYWQGVTIMLFGMWELTLILFSLSEFQIFWNNLVVGIVVLILGLTIASEKRFMSWLTIFMGAITVLSALLCEGSNLTSIYHSLILGVAFLFIGNSLYRFLSKSIFTIKNKEKYSC